jgi:hypothetical protein
MPEKVKCRDCGFLAKHGLSSRAPTPRFYEIDTEDRCRPAEFFRHTPDAHLGAIDTHLVCFLRKADLMAESAIGEAGGVTEAGALYAIAQDRDCESFYPHIPGLSPKEHYDQVMMQKLEADRRAYEDRTEESRRRYEEEMRRTAEADSRSFDTANESRNRALIKASIIVGVLIGLAQIIAAYIFSNRESYTDHLLRRLFGE